MHPARAFGFDELLEGLTRSRASGAVVRRYEPSSGLSLFIYSNMCVYDDLWDEFSTIARGLVLDEKARRIVATPFPKFFNAGEARGQIQDGPFETFEKLDGSLIILFEHNHLWRCVTKGAFDSAQAQWAQRHIDALDMSAFSSGTTYLLEAVYPENRIVIRYPEPALVMLAAFDQSGQELSFEDLAAVCRSVGWRRAQRHAFASVADLVAHAETLPSTEEGFVVRFLGDGTRLKIKGAEYRRIHALISRCTPLAMWDAMRAGDDMSAVRRDLPEEFWGDFDAINAALNARLDDLKNAIEGFASTIAHLTDKEVGLALNSYPERVRPFLFAFRKGGFQGRTRDQLFRVVRPTGNELDGYEPSYAMGRLLDEAV